MSQPAPDPFPRPAEAPTLRLVPSRDAALGSVLAWTRCALPVTILAEHLPGVPGAVRAGRASGHLLVDDREWVRVSPFSTVRPAPGDSFIAAAVVEAASQLHPEDLEVQLAWLRLCVVSGRGSPRDYSRRFEALVSRSRFGRQIETLLERIEREDLARPLLARHRAPMLRLLIEGDRCDLVRPLLAPTDHLLNGLLAIRESKPRLALTFLRDATGPEATFARVRAHAALQAPARMLAELDHPARYFSRPIDRIRACSYRHFCATNLGTAAELDDATRALEAMLATVQHPGLEGAMLDMLVNQAIGSGDIVAARTRFARMRTAFARVGTASADSLVTLREGELAINSGDYRQLEEVLKRPPRAGTHARWQALDRAALLTMKGDWVGTLAIPEAQQVPLLAAWTKSKLGHHRRALHRMDTPSPSPPTRWHTLRTALFASRLGIERPLPDSAGNSSHQHTVAAEVRGRLALWSGDLDTALEALSSGIQGAARRGLVLQEVELLTVLADVHARMGRTDRALEAFDRFVELDRHPHSFATNWMTVGRAIVTHGRIDPDLLHRVVRQQDVDTLQVLSRRIDPGPAGRAVLERLEPEVRAHLNRAFVPLKHARQLVLHPVTRHVELPDGRRADLKRAGAPWRVLTALAEERRRSPGSTLDCDALISAGWPGEHIHWEAARSRLYTVMRRLRSRGLTCIETVDGGYRLAPTLDVRVCAETDG